MFQVQVPFKTYFDVETLAKFHRVITMEDFFQSGLADQVIQLDHSRQMNEYNTGKISKYIVLSLNVKVELANRMHKHITGKV